MFRRNARLPSPRPEGAAAPAVAAQAAAARAAARTAPFRRRPRKGRLDLFACESGRRWPSRHGAACTRRIQRLGIPHRRVDSEAQVPRRGAWIVDRTNEDRIRCYFDGACPRNQFRGKGRMKAAFVVGDTKAISEVLGIQAPSGRLRSTSNAEYMAQILLLEHIHQIARRTLPECYMIR